MTSITLIFLLSSFAFASFNLFVTILLIRIFFKASSLTSAINVPSFATDTLPVSSETIIAKLSDSFEIPIPALCLVPSSFAISWSPAKGNIHAAAAILLLLITTAPSVIFKVTMTNGEVKYIDNPSNYPEPALIASAEEPMVKADILAPSEFVGNIMELCQDRRGVFKDMKYLDDTRVNLHYELPLNEIVYDFFDALKSRTKGYASFDYEMIGYAPSKLVKLDIMLNGDVVDALSFIIHTDKAYSRARKIVEKLKENIPRQLFEVPIQAAIGGKIIARETVKAMSKDVLAKCYGGDISRKKKLLEKQKEGKKRMRQVGNVEIPQKAFMSVLKLDDK